MRNYVIVTDSSADLSSEMSEALGLRTIQLGVMVEGEAVQANNAVDVKAIYEMLRQKKMATTSAVNIEQFLEIFEGIVKEDLDILYLGFSSGLSGTFSASAVAMQELSEKYRRFSENNAFSCECRNTFAKLADDELSHSEMLMSESDKIKSGLFGNNKI